MAGFGGKGKPWGTDGWSGRIPLNESCCVVGVRGDSLRVNIDVANGCCNGHLPLLLAREILRWSAERPNVCAVMH